MIATKWRCSITVPRNKSGFLWELYIFLLRYVKKNFLISLLNWEKHYVIRNVKSDF